MRGQRGESAATFAFFDVVSVGDEGYGTVAAQGFDASPDEVSADSASTCGFVAHGQEKLSH